MITSLTLWSLALAGLASAVNEKRGLCFVTSNHPGDYKLWTQPGSQLSWYYNYAAIPTSTYRDLTQEEFEFVPMMWGVGANPEDTTFLQQVTKLIKDGRNISHVLGFNEPNVGSDYGGSNVSPDIAARAWVANFEPLGKMGVKLGLPAMTGGWDGLPWLKNFLGNCSQIVSAGGPKKNCTWDFLPVHWYDNFEGLASHIGERRATWPGAEIWVTEYAYAHRDAAETNAFFDQTLDYFDKEPWLGRYTYFGAFRSGVSNVGANAPFLNDRGKLTYIGQNYLGLDGPGIESNDNAASGGLVPAWFTVMAAILATILRVFF